MRVPYPARLARLAAGKTKPQACKAARISVSHLNKLECGYPASLRVMRALAECYQCGDYPFRRHREPTTHQGGRGARKPGARAAASPAVVER